MGVNRDDDPKVRQIREAARALFLRHGFEQVSTATLARVAGVSKETLYSRYPNKEAVLSDILEHLIRLDAVELEFVLPVGTREELELALMEFAQGFTARLMQPDYVELVRIVMAEAPRIPHIGQVFRETVAERALGRVLGLLGDARHAGLVGDAVDLAAAARLFVGPLVMQVVLNRLLVAPPDSASATANLDVAAHVTIYLNGVAPL